jgi:hypothetical protein
MASTGTAIQAFWAWWSTARPRIEAAIPAGPRPDLVDEVTTHVKAIDPRLAWELGEGQRAAHALCLTPEGDPALRVVTERWLRAAPPADATWEYHPARPASLAALGATLEIGRRRLVPAEARLLVQVDEDRQVVDVGVHHPALRKLPRQVQPTVAYLILSWLLGEDGVERWIGEVEIHRREPGGTVTADALPEIVQALAERHPEPTWALLQGVDKHQVPPVPVLAVARRPLKRIDWPLFDLHGLVTFSLAVARGEVDDAFDQLERPQRELEASLGDQAVLVVRELRPDRRNLHLYCDGEGPGRELVESWRSAQGQPVTVSWEPDPAWDAVRPFR